MLRERRAHSSTEDAASGTARLEVSSAVAGGRAREVEATVLLDKSGKVVGVDVEPDAPGRTVVMAGRHEDVASTKATKVTVTRGADGEIAAVEVTGLKK
jgi:hypothetical protein